MVFAKTFTAAMGGDMQFIHPDGLAAALQGRADLVVMLGRLGALGLTSKRLQKFSSTAIERSRSALFPGAVHELSQRDRRNRQGDQAASATISGG
jgi:hypothetical protein